MRNNDLTKSDPEFYFLPVEVVKTHMTVIVGVKLK